MPRMTGHGGGCCGARHVHGFSGADNAAPNTINAAVAQVPVLRMTEVILNGNQCRDNPNVLLRLSQLGFVLVGHYINGNHMSHNYVFHRCDRRLPLTNLPFAWPGQVITPQLQGDLPPVPAAQGIAPAVGRAGDEQRYDATIRHGDTVEVRSPTSRRHGRQFRVDRFQQDYGGDTYCVMRDNGIEFRIIRQNCRKIIAARPPAPAIPAAPPVIVPQRHEQPDAAALMAAAAEPVVPTVMISFYHNVYRNGGRSDIAWSSLEAARAARGTPMRVDRHDLLTNGEFLWVEGVNA